jgi:CBS domain-containing protein
VSQIARTFIEHKIGCIPILEEDGSLVGIVTQSDLLPLIAHSVRLEGWA